VERTRGAKSGGNRLNRSCGRERFTKEKKIAARENFPDDNGKLIRTFSKMKTPFATRLDESFLPFALRDDGALLIKHLKVSLEKAGGKKGSERTRSPSPKILAKKTSRERK